MPIDCDTIDWLVNMLGTLELLESVSDCENVAIMGRSGKERDDFRNKRDGLYFDGAHWYSIKNGIAGDSYSKDYQITGTDHFCQTFALMIFIGEDALLKAGEYDLNIKRAMQFWRGKFSGHKELLEWLCRQIPPEQKMTPELFMQFLSDVEEASAKLVGCRHG